MAFDAASTHQGLAHEAPVVGGIEAGGTKFVYAIGSGPGPLLRARREFPTGNDPGQTMREVIEWLDAESRRVGPMRAIGVASFGPVELDPSSPRYGSITTTPKPGWQGSDIVGPLRRAFSGLPIGFDTDVHGAALGEARFLASVRGHFRGVLNGYIPSPELEESGIDRFIVPPALGDDAGVYGALALAHDALAARAIQ
jgi:predicted NBD/HSP70 family sugar kinase